MNIPIKISTKDIIRYAKDETYLFVRANEVGSSEKERIEYYTQAGVDEIHERKLKYYLSECVSELYSSMNEFLLSGWNNELGDDLELSLKNQCRFREERIGALNGLTNSFLKYGVIAKWWDAVRPEKSNPYYEKQRLASEEIKKLFFYKGEPELKLYGEE